MPIIYIIAGCNGAGKTTVAYNLLPEIFNFDVYKKIRNILSAVKKQEDVSGKIKVALDKTIKKVI